MIVLRIVIPQTASLSGSGPHFVAGRDLAGPAPTGPALHPRTHANVAATPPLKAPGTAKLMRDLIHRHGQIQVAVGMLMMRREVTAAQAHAHLTLIAARTGLHRADVANVIIADHYPHPPRSTL